jgi:hypothetical protein
MCGQKASHRLLNQVVHIVITIAMFYDVKRKEIWMQICP